MKQSLTDFIRLVMRGVDYHALYPCRVVAQNADGTLELQPDSAKVAPASRVPLRLGLPGVAVKVAVGARVLLGFEGGDPAAPVATVWEAGGLVELQLGVGATESVVLGTSFLVDLNDVLDAIATFCGKVATPLGLTDDVTKLTKALAAYKLKAHLSSLVKVKP